MDSRKHVMGLVAVGMSGSLALTACGGGGEDLTAGSDSGGGDGRAIEMGLVAWDDAIAVTHMWKLILEEKDYDVTVTGIDVAPMYQGLADGDLDLYMNVWLPVTHGDYWEDYGGGLEDLGAWYDNAVLTLTVPAYMDDVDSIADLPDHVDELDGRIVGIDPGAGLTRITKEDAMPGYGLDEGFELVESSSAAMIAELDAAVSGQDPIVVTLWRPHQAYAQFDLKDLEDPEGLMGEAETINAVGRDGFREDHPEAAGWLEDFELTDDEFSSLAELTLEEYEDDPEEGARVWLSDNPAFLERTLGEDAEGLEF
ncbi:glycine betaine ABC transporter substrate-binding protein [Nocardiopsis sp. MG754419]|uniref:glycine betaine ABC transporter substrate-binding protein n=1 Tax=Nocardiopsis sp. MG754419 TaxID=2259865 RepID=UPI001BA4575A|nr:glycine betaine ABC transporter substrate-binding protein [Nocardiopsis sp. MG754419]MBR8743144.1 glycine/betaine ABC transporter substrate-binding protein [Nocardiopsis sp. MG754419]